MSIHGVHAQEMRLLHQQYKDQIDSTVLCHNKEKNRFLVGYLKVTYMASSLFLGQGFELSRGMGRTPHPSTGPRNITLAPKSLGP